MAINSSRDHLKVTLNPRAKKAEQVISLYGNRDGPKIKVIIMDIITIQKNSPQDNHRKRTEIV